MLSIILTGHGGFASGMEKAMKQILGEQSQFIVVSLQMPVHGGNRITHHAKRHTVCLAG